MRRSAANYSRYIRHATPNEWFFPVPVRFGPGSISNLPSELITLNAQRPLIVTDKGLAGQPFIDEIVENLESVGIEPKLFSEVLQAKIGHNVLIDASMVG